ncbi:MAG: hypothetical protein KatS3mg001_407 [Candidatus Pacearchaeota archaeon]|nr:MAG: hypothetical protein KatS3mg001_407 [Candidatus Pacearchaeota archaeon]
MKRKNLVFLCDDETRKKLEIILSSLPKGSVVGLSKCKKILAYPIKDQIGLYGIRLELKCPKEILKFNLQSSFVNYQSNENYLSFIYLGNLYLFNFQKDL